MVFDPKFIRNFSIVAHIDHGKSTLADQLLLQSGAITQREFREQLLDDMDLERERGITIKARAVAINYTLDGQVYELNLIDTPGHVDFHYEVSRSLAACEGAILLVDATQGVQAQTVANAYLAVNNNLAIVPVLNKIDMQAARPEEIKEEIMVSLGIDPAEVLAVSAKTGQGVPDVFRAIIERVPAPAGDPKAPLRALIFDSKFDDYQGVITYVRVVDGALRVGQKIRLMAEGSEYEVTGLGRFRPREVACDELGVGQVGYVVANIKKLSDIRIGDTITQVPRSAEVALPGYQEPVPVVFCGLFPATNNQFDDLRTALQKLALNDSSFTFEPESSDALGFGFRCGFLGMLHMEIVQQRLERESNLSLVQTAPTVTYEILGRDGEVSHISNPTRIPGRRCDRGVSRADRPPQLHHSQRLDRRDHAALRRSAWRLPEDRVSLADPRDSDLRAAAGRDDLRSVRQAQERDAGLRHDGLRGDRLSCGRFVPARYSGRRPARRCACRRSSIGLMPIAAVASWSRSSRVRSSVTSSRWRSRRRSAAG